MEKNILCFVCLFFIALSGYSQDNINIISPKAFILADSLQLPVRQTKHISLPPVDLNEVRKPITRIVLADSADLRYYGKKNGLLAASEVFGLNMSIWAFNRFAMKAEYAYIDMSTIKRNFKKGFVWDNDQMATNMFGHPYHGSLYYQSARSNGYSFWQSGGFAFGGSLMWELAMENEFPSVNDIIATPVGGLALGEVLYSTSDLILDDRTQGKERIGREIAAFMVSPTRGLTRLINGDAWKRRSTSGRQFGIPDMKVEISTGMRTLKLKDDFLTKSSVWTTELKLEYGERFDTEYQKPYDYFTVAASFNLGLKQPIVGQMNITGRLHGADLIDNEKNYLSIGAYQHFVYYDSQSITGKLDQKPYGYASPASFGTGFIYKNKRFKKILFDSYAHFNVVLLGATLSEFYNVDMRKYNMASGFSWQGGFRIGYKDLLRLSSDYEAYRLYTWKGYPLNTDFTTIDIHDFSVQGDKSQATLHTAIVRADVKLRKHTYLTLMTYFYSRVTDYAEPTYENTKTHSEEGRIMLTYKF